MSSTESVNMKFLYLVSPEYQSPSKAFISLKDLLFVVCLMLTVIAQMGVLRKNHNANVAFRSTIAKNWNEARFLIDLLLKNS